MCGCVRVLWKYKVSVHHNSYLLKDGRNFLKQTLLRKNRNKYIYIIYQDIGHYDFVHLSKWMAYNCNLHWLSSLAVNFTTYHTFSLSLELVVKWSLMGSRLWTGIKSSGNTELWRHFEIKRPTGNGRNRLQVMGKGRGKKNGRGKESGGVKKW